MVPIKFRGKDSIDVLYNELFTWRKKKNRKSREREDILHKIDEWCWENLNHRTFESVVRADYDELVQIKNEYNNIKLDSVNPREFPEDCKKFILEVLYRDKFPRQKFVEELQVTVCPYCNRNFINSTYKRSIYVWSRRWISKFITANIRTVRHYLNENTQNINYGGGVSY